MSASEGNVFDFDFGSEDRAKILEEARQTASGLRSPLSGQAPTLAPDAAATRLLEELTADVAQFSAFPDVIELQETHFTEHQLPVPPRFRDLSKDHRFYWARFPITLHPSANRAFTKLECAVEFNPGAEGPLRPRAQTILPDRKFQQLLQANMGLELKIGESFEFELAGMSVPPSPSPGLPVPGQHGQGTPPSPTPAGPTAPQGPQSIPLPVPKIGGSVDARVAASAGLVAGPFLYRVMKALIEHSPTGTEKVFWRLSDAHFLMEEGPNFIVVLQVPKGVKELKIAAALQAYHSFQFLSADLSAVFAYLRGRVVEFFKKGAPLADKKMWDVTSRL